jgi:hypothetical protein
VYLERKVDKLENENLLVTQREVQSHLKVREMEEGAQHQLE